MVLNGKAVLIEQAFGATIIRNDRVAFYVIVTMLAASTVISFRLYYCMDDGWQTNTQLRWQVFSLSIALLMLSVTACLYLCRRHRPTLYLHSTCERLNSQVQLVSGEQPANYNAVNASKFTSSQTTHTDYSSPPPLYNSIFNI